MAALNFNFQEDDAVVRDNLNKNERDKVTRWQTNDAYTFEFHDGHDTGNPIYFRINGNKDKSNAPKIDTLNKEAADYHGKLNGKKTGRVTVTAFANGNKLSELKASEQADIEAIVSESWTQIALMAHRFWNKIPAPADIVADTHRPCKKPGCLGQVEIVTQNPTAAAMCDTCYQFS